MQILYATLLLAATSLVAQAQQYRFENPRLYAGRSDPYDSDLNDYGAHLSVDASDNLYMALGYQDANFGGGSLGSPGPGPDYGAASLTTTGTLRYVKVYAQYGADEALDGVTDPNGTFYTCGYYSQSASVGGFPIAHPGGLVTKFRPDGTLAWATGLGTSGATDNDKASTIVKNQYGQLTVFGYVQGFNGIFMKRLDTATGAVTRSVMPSGQNGQLSNVRESITLPDGSIVITGEHRSPNLLGFPISPAEQARWGMVARIDTGGNVLWVTKFGTKGFGWDLALDAAGNVLVAARMGIGDDSMTTELQVLRVSPAGTILNQYRTYTQGWSAGYYPQTTNPSIASQADGSFALCYWTNEQRLSAPHDTIFLGGGARNGIVELFNATGAVQQILPIRSYGNNGVALPSDIAALSGGRYAVTGAMQDKCFFGYGQFLSTPMFSSEDLFTVIVGTTTPPPAPTWPVTFGWQQDDLVRGIVKDVQGNTYVSLAFRGTITLGSGTLTSYSNNHRDMALAKFDKNGYLEWIQNYGNSTFELEPQGVNVDAAGNVYWAGSIAGGSYMNTVAGYRYVSSSGSYDAFVARFDPATSLIHWIKTVGGSGNDYLYGCFVSNSGNVYAGGSYTGAINFATTAGNVALTNAGGLDAFIVKFDNNGNGIYASRFGSADNDEVKSIEYNGGDLIACGYMGNNCTFPSGTNASPSTVTLPSINASRDGWAARINSEGRAVWVKNFGTIFNDEAQSICLDPSTGNVFTVAQVADAPVSFNSVNYSGYGGNDIAVLGWNFYTQAPVWIKRVGSTTGDIPSIIRWDGTRLVVAGYMGGNLNYGTGTLTTYGAQDGVILRYNKTTGAITSAENFGGSGNDRATALWCNTATREEYIGGVFSGTATLPGAVSPAVSNGMFDGFLTRYTPAVGARLGGEPTALDAETLNAWPMPFRGSLTVETDQAVKVYDLQGRLKANADASPTGQVTLELGRLPKGVYIVRTAEGKVARVVKE